MHFSPGSCYFIPLWSRYFQIMGSVQNNNYAYKFCS
jgi:hypothetical protein